VRTVGDLERNRVARPHRHTIEALVKALDLDDAERDAIWASARPPRSTRPTGGRPAPARYDALPPDHGALVGVQADLAALREWYDGPARVPHCPWPVVVSGMPGVGKTRFAARAGRELADRFTDHRIYVDLRGTGDQPMDAAEALGHVLRQMGVQDAIPDAVDERGRLFRAQMRTSATLLILDDVRDEAHVRALLPDNTGDSLVVLVSRRTLAGLDAVRRITLRELDQPDAVELLGALAGRDRITSEAASAADLARMCGFLPLALRIVGNRLASRPSWTVAEMTERLRPVDDRLSQLAANDLDVRAAIARSYEQLTPEVRKMFHRLAFARGGSVEPRQAARLFGGDLGHAERLLEELVDASLLGTADVAGKYVLNELLRLFARETLAAEESPYTIDQLNREAAAERALRAAA
jgi:hypothetical protein